MIRIIIEQDDRAGGIPQVHTFTAPDQAQARDGGGAPPASAVLRHRAMKGPAAAQTSTSLPRPEDVNVRDAGSAPRVFQAHVIRSATAPIMPGSSGVVKPSNGGTAPDRKT